MDNCNLNLLGFLTIYSQSERSTGGTRGYDPITYVETKLDRELIPKIFDPKTKLVILTGNAGDGKTAFIQRIEDKAEKDGAIFSKKTDNGCVFTLNNVKYETLYDGSQDFEGAANDAVLAGFFNELEGTVEPSGSFTKIIAINEGKLRDFVLFKPQYKWLGKFVHHYLENDDYKQHESLVYVNLNLRSVVNENGSTDSILDYLLDKFLDIDNSSAFWQPCSPENCAYGDKCYIKYNVDSFRDPKKGAEIRKRLKHLILTIHFRKLRHITMRDVRSILSFILFNKFTCQQIQKELDEGKLQVNRFYYNAVFDSGERDRIAQLLAEIDVAAVSNPKLDNFIHFNAPDNQELLYLMLQGATLFDADLSYLQYLHKNRPQGTQDNDIIRKLSAKLYHNSLRRKLYFEGDNDRLDKAGLPKWEQLLPYRQLDRFSKVIKERIDTGNIIRDEITLAISKSERIYNETVGTENLCLRSTSATRSQAKAFYGFPASDFEVVVKEIGSQNAYLEYCPNSIYYRYKDNTSELEVPLDLFEVLCRIQEGYIPTASEIRTFFLNLEMFKRRIIAKRSDRVILTEDDTNLYELKRDASERLVMTKLGG